MAAGRSVEAALSAARRAIDREADNAGGRLDGISDILASAAIETAEAVAKLENVMAELDIDPGRLEQVEERLFALRAAARKYDTDVDSLALHRGEDLVERRVHPSDRMPSSTSVSTNPCAVGSKAESSGR